MDEYYFLSKILLLGGLLIFSAIFSGAEVSLFSLDKKKLKEFNKDKSLLDRYILELLDTPRRLLVTILIGNTLFNVGASIIAVTLALDLAALMQWDVDLILTSQIILLTLLILLFGEITPKVWANKHPVKFARISVFPLYWIGVLIYPVSKIITDIIKFFSSKIVYNKSKTAILSSELSELADIGVEKGTIEEDEQELIQGLVTFRTITTREVMTPRVDMTFIQLDTSFDDLMKIITESGHSRIPLYDNDLDDIIGIIYAKDLLPFVNKPEAINNLSLRKIARKAIFIPESKLINDLLQEFKTKKMHVGIVVDEYGGTAGLVSLEDILEEIVGEIRDEYDNEETEITKLSDNKYLLLGKLDIDELNELFNENFSSETDDYDTVGGFIFSQAGNIPDVGFSFVFKNYKFTVEEVENKRINKVHLEKINPDPV